MPLEMARGSVPVVAQAATPGGHCHERDSEKSTLEAGALAQPASQSFVRRSHGAESSASSLAGEHSSVQHAQHDPNAPCKHGTACKCPCAHFPALAVSLTL